MCLNELCPVKAGKKHSAIKGRKSDHYLLKALAHKYKFGPHEAVINCCLVIIVGPVHKVIQYIVDWYSLSNKTWTGITLILWSFNPNQGTINFYALGDQNRRILKSKLSEPKCHSQGWLS